MRHRAATAAAAIIAVITLGCVALLLLASPAASLSPSTNHLAQVLSDSGATYVSKFFDAFSGDREPPHYTTNRFTGTSLQTAVARCMALTQESFARHADQLNAKIESLGAELVIREDDVERLMFTGSLLTCLHKLPKPIPAASAALSQEQLVQLFHRETETPLAFTTEEGEALKAYAEAVAAAASGTDAGKPSVWANDWAGWFAFAAVAAAVQAAICAFTTRHRNRRTGPAKKRK